MAEETPSSAQGSASKPSMVEMESSLYLTASQGSTINPFEVGVEDRLHLTALSPSVFDKVESTPSSGSTEFRWSIDQMAILHPADIPMEEVSRQHDTLHLTHDRDVEEKAQRAINQFFSQSVVVPSPWTQSSPRRKTRMTGQQGGTESADQHASFTETAAKEGTTHASCQTLLTLPPDFDLEAILGPEHFSTPQPVPEDQEQEVLSTSSLRRKLFFQGDLSTPFSPVKSSSPKCKKGGGQSIDSPPLSPVNHAASTCQPHVRSSPLLKTPSSGSQFSSSPIILSKMTPSNRLTTTPKPSRSSIIPVSMGTPAISPIGKSVFRTPSSSDRDVSVFTIPPTPSCRRIKGTPSPCSHARLSAMTTPNLSPIGAFQRHCRPPNSYTSTSPRESTARRGSHVLSLSFADEDKPQQEATESDCQPVLIGCPEVHDGQQSLSSPESQSNMEHSCNGNTTEDELLANGILVTVSDGGFCGERANRKYPDHYYCDFNIVPPGSEVNHDCSQMQVDSGINCQTSSSMEVEGAEEKENLRNVSRRLHTVTKCQLESVPENVSMEVMDEDKMADMVKYSQGQADCDPGTDVFCRKQPLVESSNLQEDFHNR
ncbi:protein aurora borealis-like [Branchiostoma floridae]|uniref:Protein aurora borealis n=1 Tax=Branchiostoma floridae TaxID=7739 RepID=A0A9J7L104_BRAFL|nr:protein aurora borealis-like [Branchiostoma floridae]XP_035674154.1 protein aurora borealis-like [Branchiostoma floridae]